MGIRPIADRVLITPLKKEAIKTAGGFEMGVTSNSEQPPFGIVEAIGVDCKEVKVGDKVCYPVNGGTVNIDNQGTAQIIIHEKAIFYIA